MGVRTRHIRMHPQSGLKRRQRFPLAIERKVDQGEAGQRPEMPGFQRESFLNIDHCRIEPAKQIMRGRALVPALGKIGERIDHAGEIFYCRFVIVPPHCLQTAQHIGIHGAVARQ